MGDADWQAATDHECDADYPDPSEAELAELDADLEPPFADYPAPPDHPLTDEEYDAVIRGLIGIVGETPPVTTRSEDPPEIVLAHPEEPSERMVMVPEALLAILHRYRQENGRDGLRHEMRHLLAEHHELRAMVAQLLRNHQQTRDRQREGARGGGRARRKPVDREAALREARYRHRRNPEMGWHELADDVGSRLDPPVSGATLRKKYIKREEVWDVT